MADTTKSPQSVGTAAGWFSDAPAGDVSFDEIFGEDSAATPAQPETAPATPAEPAPAPAREFLVETSTGTKYRTLEDVVRGTEEKDRVIELQRRRSIERTGYDPISDRYVGVPGQPSTPTQTSPAEEESYLRNPRAFVRDLRAALTSNDDEAFARVHGRYIAEVNAAQLAPYIPTVVENARDRAVGRVASEIPDFPKFLGSEDYKKSLEGLPALRSAIETAERDPAFAAQLPELYRVAYYATQGRRVPDLLKAAAPAQPAAQPVRQTLQPSALAPTPETAPQAQTIDELLSTTEGRKSVIADFEKRYGNIKLAD